MSGSNEPGLRALGAPQGYPYETAPYYRLKTNHPQWAQQATCRRGLVSARHTKLLRQEQLTMVLDPNSKERHAALLREIMASQPQGRFDENALPSYTHRNRLMAWLFWKRIDAALSFLNGERHLKVLDFGCGGAITFAYLASLGSTIVGCDTDIDLTRQACERMGMAPLLYRSLEEVQGDGFDYILALDVLEHIEDSQALLERFGSLLRKGGKIILSGPTENLFYRLGRTLAGFSGHYHVKNIYQIEREFRRHGFQRETVRVLYYPIPLFRVSLWTRP